MQNKILALTAGAALIASATPALATDWAEKLQMCAAAAESEGLVAPGEYRAKFVRGGGGSTKTIALALIPNGGGDTIDAVCKIRRGEVSEIRLEA
ncbi:hypothetical protein [Hyphococcus sp.]|uniref:hypothetical protein n=1 Tax=Hyphococcus sp. TaxID=2038636 RepID=UPI003CCBC524